MSFRRVASGLLDIIYSAIYDTSCFKDGATFRTQERWYYYITVPARLFAFVAALATHASVGFSTEFVPYVHRSSQDRLTEITFISGAARPSHARICE
jgi:hypothetical protein